MDEFSFKVWALTLLQKVFSVVIGYFVILTLTLSFVTGEFPPKYRKIMQNVAAFRNRAMVPPPAEEQASAPPATATAVMPDEDLMIPVSAVPRGTPVPDNSGSLEGRLNYAEKGILSLQSQVRELTTQIENLRVATTAKAAAPQQR